ncbi:hypothetical protein OROHE_002429 [Orobanche hederae]
MASITCNKCFSSNYMLLNPGEAGFLDLFKILFSSDIGNRKFVDCPDDRVHEPLFWRRWIIFVSVLVQKMLKAMAKPMSGFGSGVEHWLNLLSGNGGFSGLMLNSLKGKVVHPDRTSENFLSFTGCIDTRLELDTSIRHEDCRYYAALTVMAAKASYENHRYIQSIVNNNWKWISWDPMISGTVRSKFPEVAVTHLADPNHPSGHGSKSRTKSKLLDPNLEFIIPSRNNYQEKATTQAFILQDKKDVIIVSFRGTETFDADAWSSDFDISWYEIPGAGKIHGGFLKALGLQKSQGWPQEQSDDKPETAYYAIRNLLRVRLQNNDRSKFIVTGHSLGGALAVLFPAVLSLHEESWLLDRLQGIYTFGQPRVGDEKFKEYMERIMEKHCINYYRFVYSYDMVPRLPYDDSTLMFKHFGTCIYYNSFYQGKVSDNGEFAILVVVV